MSIIVLTSDQQRYCLRPFVNSVAMRARIPFCSSDET